MKKITCLIVLLLLVAFQAKTAKAILNPQPRVKHAITSDDWKRLRGEFFNSCLSEGKDIFKENAGDFCTCFASSVIDDLKKEKFQYWEELEERRLELQRIMMRNTQACVEIVNSELGVMF